MPILNDTCSYQESTNKSNCEEKQVTENENVPDLSRKITADIKEEMIESEDINQDLNPNLFLECEIKAESHYDKMFKCSKCSKMFPNNAGLEHHISTGQWLR